MIFRIHPLLRRPLARVLAAAVLASVAITPAWALSTGSGLALAGVAVSLAAADSMHAHDHAQASLQRNPAMALIDFDAAKRALQQGRTARALAKARQAAGHDPSAAFAGGPQGLQAFLQRIDATRAAQERALSQSDTQMPWDGSLLRLVAGIALAGLVIGVLEAIILG